MRFTRIMAFVLGAMTLTAAPSLAQQAPARATAAVASAAWTPAQVREAQQALTAAKYDGAYYRGTVDGIMGRKTVEAIREYQRMHQLTVTGELSDGLLAQLKTNATAAAARPATSQPSAPAAARPVESTPAAGQRTPAAATPAQRPSTTPAAAAAPMTRVDIIAAQEGLARAKLYEGTPSGMLDAPTVAAIRAFQTANDMTVDGTLTASLLEDLKMVK